MYKKLNYKKRTCKKRMYKKRTYKKTTDPNVGSAHSYARTYYQYADYHDVCTISLEEQPFLH